MDYFRQLLQLLLIEKEADRQSFRDMNDQLSVAQRRANGTTWFPIAIKGTEVGRGDYLTVEVERTTHQDIIHQLRFGMSAALFSNHHPSVDRIEGTITHISSNLLRLSLRTDELPDWTRNGKLGIDTVFDSNSYNEMEFALKQAVLAADKNDQTLVRILTGSGKTSSTSEIPVYQHPHLNRVQNEAVAQILAAEHLAIIHGPPGTGKTTTIVQAIKAISKQEGKKTLVVAPSNAAVDLLSEKLSAEGLRVVRIGNPARVSDRLQQLTLDEKISAHSASKDIKKLKKQAAEYRQMAHKYKRNFGPAEREQRKALFAEASKIGKEVEQTEQYIIDQVLDGADVITATLVGAAHYTIRHLSYHTVVIDEAGQALEPAIWIPVLKAQKVIMAGDHCQLPPTVKSIEAAKKGLAETLMEKCVKLHPECVVLLQEQYRMHQTIMQFPSQQFYGGVLKASLSVANRLLFSGDVPLMFIDTAGCGFNEQTDGTAISNVEEAQLLINHLVSLVEQLRAEIGSDPFPSIAVIAPYKQQVELLGSLVNSHLYLSAFSTFISVNTIDSFQGQERDVVYISMVRKNSERSIGFLADIRRINVAITRARKKLVVIGDSATIAQHPFYSDLIAYSQLCNGYESAWSFTHL